MEDERKNTSHDGGKAPNEFPGIRRLWGWGNIPGVLKKKKTENPPPRTPTNNNTKKHPNTQTKKNLVRPSSIGKPEDTDHNT